MQHIGVPLKQEKTVYPTTMLTFLGLELDTNDMEIRLPMEKLQKNSSKTFIVQTKEKDHLTGTSITCRAP